MASQFDNDGSSGFGKPDRARPNDAEYVVRVGAGGGIRGALDRAQKATGTTPKSFVALAREGRAELSIDATFSPRPEQLELDALTVRARLPVRDADRGLALAEEALTRFGGNGYVAFGAARGEPRDGFETTVCFPDVVPWIAHNCLVVPRLYAIDDVERYARMLAIANVTHAVDGRALWVREHQLRLRPSLRSLSAAFAAGVREGFRTTLYAAALPVTRSVRLEQFSRQDVTWLEVAITRGLSRRSCSSSDLLEMDTFLRSSLGLGWLPLAWRVRATGVVVNKPRVIAGEGRTPTKSAPRLRPALRVIEGGRSARA